MDTAIKAAYEKFGFATQREFDVWDYNRRREKAQWDMVSRLNYAQEKGEEIGLQKGEEIGLQKGEEIGLHKGQEKKALEIARNALGKGATLEFVHDITGLDIEIIKGLSRS